MASLGKIQTNSVGSEKILVYHVVKRLFASVFSRPSNMAARTTTTRWAPYGDHRIRWLLAMRALAFSSMQPSARARPLISRVCTMTPSGPGSGKAGLLGRCPSTLARAERLASRMARGGPLPLAQQRGGRAVRLSRGAAALLLDLQADLRRAIAGERPKVPWARSLGRTRLADVLSKLTFVMLGPLWAECHRRGVVTVPGISGWHWPEDWTQCWLPPDISAPALTAAAAFLAAEGGTPLEGITWNPRVLLSGEDARISAETLLWHLNTHDDRLVRALFLRPAIETLSLLLTALDRDTRGQGAEYA